MSKEKFRVVTLNLWGAFMKPEGRIEVLSESWPEIKGDFLCLQESFEEQVEILADKLALPYFFHSPIDQEGPAILSRYPLENKRAVSLDPSVPQRSIALAQVSGKNFHLASTHISFAPRELNVSQIKSLSKALPEKFICGCDLNAKPEEARPLLFGISDASSGEPTWPADEEALQRGWREKMGEDLPFEPEKSKIDYLLYRGLQARNSGMLLPRKDGLPLSDHFLLWADFLAS